MAGLKDFKPQDRPYSPLIFFTFRIMTGLGFLMFGLGLLCGWITTEVGRQSYTTQGLMRSTDSVSPIALPGIATSMTAFVIVYLFVFAAGLIFILRLMNKEPDQGESGLDPHVPVRTSGTHPGPVQGHASNADRRRAVRPSCRSRQNDVNGSGALASGCSDLHPRLHGAGLHRAR